MAARKSKTTVISGAPTSVIPFESVYEDMGGNKLIQTNSIVTNDPVGMFKFGENPAAPIVECNFDATSGNKSVVLDANSLSSKTVADFEAIAATNPDIKVDKTNPANVKIAFNAEAIDLIESKENKGIKLHVKEGSGTITIDMQAREIAISSTSGVISEKIVPADPAKTFNTTIAQNMLEMAFSQTSHHGINILTEKDGATLPVSKLDDLTPEFIAALGQTAKISATAKSGTIKYGDFEFFMAFDVEGYNIGSKDIQKNNFIYVKAPGGNYLLDRGSFRKVKKMVLTYGDDATGNPDVSDMGIDFNLDRTTNSNVELPLKLTADATGAGFKRDKQSTMLNSFLKFAAPSTFKNSEPLADKGLGTYSYKGFSISKDDKVSVAPINTAIRSTATLLSESVAASTVAPYSAEASADAAGIVSKTAAEEAADATPIVTLEDTVTDTSTSDTTTDTTTSDTTTSELPDEEHADETAEHEDTTEREEPTKDEEAPEREDTAPSGGESAKSADKPKSPSKTKTVKKNLGDVGKFVKSLGQMTSIVALFLFVGAVLLPAATAVLLPAALGVLAAGGGMYFGSALFEGNYEFTLSSIIDSQKARSEKRSKTAEKCLEREASIERMKSELAALESDPSATPEAKKKLQDKIQKLEDKNYMALAKCDFKTIEVLKKQKGNQAARNKEKELGAAFNAAHAETPATEDEIKEHKEKVKAAKAAAKTEAEKAFICDNQYAIARNVMVNSREKDTKQFLSNLSSDETAFITDATEEIAAEAKNASAGRPASRTILGSDIVDAVGHKKNVKPEYQEARRDLGQLYDEKSSSSKSEKWVKDYVERYEKFQKAYDALEEAGASEEKLKEWSDTFAAFERETGNSYNQKILESDSKALKSLKKTIQKRRDKTEIAVDRTKLANPDRFVEELRASTAPASPASADTSTASTTTVEPSPVGPTPVVPTPVAPTAKTTTAAHDEPAPVSRDEADPLARS